MWLWAVELHELGFRRRSDRYWQCERRFGLPEQAHLSIFASEQRIPAGKGRKRCLVELAAFHVTFEIDRDNVHFYYHERLDNEWEAGGHTSAGEMARLGQELARRFAAVHPTKVLTAETSAIAPALAAAMALNVPVVFARKHAPLTMDYTIISENARSRTHGNLVELMVSTEYLRSEDRILIVDDFLATAQTIQALVRLVAKANAQVVGIGTVIEKQFEHGRENLCDVPVPIESLAVITSMENGKIEFKD